MNKRRFDDMEWAAGNQTGLAKRYAGQWIGIYKRKVVGTLAELDALEQQGKLPVRRREIVEFWVDDGRIVTPF